jgi:hypothetical protein
MVPVDGRFTGAFLFRYATKFYDPKDEQEIFRIAFGTFQTIANAVGPGKYLGKHPMHMFTTKIIDNGVMGFVARTRKQFQDLIPSGVQ